MPPSLLSSTWFIARVIVVATSFEFSAEPYASNISICMQRPRAPSPYEKVSTDVSFSICEKAKHDFHDPQFQMYRVEKEKYFARDLATNHVTNLKN